MSIEIKTATLDPVRNTYAHIERRFGDKPASRYQEATYDVQSEENFHYRPLWQPEYELSDTRRTAIKMSDWYAFKDPRQYYYGTYVQQRAKMQESAESNYAFFEKRGLAEKLPDAVRDVVISYLLPLRHVEHTANLNNVYCSAYGYGTAITQAMLFCGSDRLGIAQYLSRIGLLLDGNTGDSLAQAKTIWMEDKAWQPMRALCEEMLTTEDWFELFIAQNLVADTLVYSLFFEALDNTLSEMNGADIAMLTEFMQVWFKDNSRWSDSVLKIAAQESPENTALLTEWASTWQQKTTQALEPLIGSVLSQADLDTALTSLSARLTKARLGQ